MLNPEGKLNESSNRVAGEGSHLLPVTQSYKCLALHRTRSLKASNENVYVKSEGSETVSARARTTEGARPNRIAWIDVAKGIGILLVVFGHLHIGLAVGIIYTFHMPLFFFLSGYVHRIQRGYASFFQKRSIHLLVPYIAFLLLLAPLELHHASHGGKPALEKAIGDILWGGDRLRGDYGVFWFITCLFATQQIANWLLSKLTLWQVAAVAATSICLVYLNSFLFPLFTLPLDLNVVAGALPFYLAGYLVREVELDRWWITCTAALGVVATIWLTYAKVPIAFDMRSSIYGVPVLSPLLAACCILALIRLSKLILLAPGLTKGLEVIGAASMGIMFIHKPLSAVPALGWLATVHPYLAGAVFSLIAYVCTFILSRFSLGRAIFLGSQKDFRHLAFGDKAVNN